MATPVFCCSAGCGFDVASAAVPAGVFKHWDTRTSTPSVVASHSLLPANRTAFRFNPAGTPQDIRKVFSGFSGPPTIGVVRLYFWFDTLPDQIVTCFGFISASGVFSGVRFNPTGNVLESVVAGGLGGSFAISAGVVYRLDIKSDFHATPITTSWSVNGAAQTGASGSTLSTVDNLRVGCGVTSTPTPTADLYVRNILVSLTGADYPLGPSDCMTLKPRADGIHGFNAAGDFKYNNSTNVPTTATDVYTYLDDPLDNTTDYIAAAAPAAGEYVEVLLDALEPVAEIRAVEVVTAQHASATTANKHSLWLVDGASITDVLTDADLSNTGTTQTSGQVLTAPSTGLAWTKDLLDAVKWRWGSTRLGTVGLTSIPFFDGLRVEVDFVPVTAALSGTIIGATEADIRAGGKTIILDLTGDTFIP